MEIFGKKSEELSVRWKPPENAGSFNVHTYLVQYRTFNGKSYTNHTQGASSDKTEYTYRIKPLEPETTYMIRVGAFNEYGHNFNDETGHQTEPARKPLLLT